MTNAKAIAVDMIKLTSESGVIDFDTPVVVETFEAANEWLRRIAIEAPKGGCYDKTWFDVVLCNGKKYSGRIDIHHISERQETVTGRLNLLDHMLDHVKHCLDNNLGDQAAVRFWGGQIVAHYKATS